MQQTSILGARCSHPTLYAERQWRKKSDFVVGFLGGEGGGFYEVVDARNKNRRPTFNAGPKKNFDNFSALAVLFVALPVPSSHREIERFFGHRTRNSRSQNTSSDPFFFCPSSLTSRYIRGRQDEAWGRRRGVKKASFFLFPFLQSNRVLGREREKEKKKGSHFRSFEL